MYPPTRGDDTDQRAHRAMAAAADIAEILRRVADLRAGGISFSDALSFEPYAEVIHCRGESLSAWYHSLSDDQREALARFVADADPDGR